MRDSLEFLLETAGYDVRTYDSAETFLEQADRGVAGCLLTDLRMPGVSGLELLRRLAERGLDLPVIVMTGHGDISVAVDVMRAGAVDVVEKPFTEERLLGSVAEAVERLGLYAATAEARLKLARLTDRERAVAEALADGRSGRSIAEELAVDACQIECDRDSGMFKTGSVTFADLVRTVLLARRTHA